MKQQLRKSLTEAFGLRGTSPNTRATYEGCVDRFERHFGKSASRLGRNEVREFLLHLVERGLSASTHNVYAGALYFLYSQVLGRPGVVARLRFRKQPFKLPEVLTQREVERLLEALPSPWLLDLLTASNLAGSVVILLVAIGLRRSGGSR
ncbi:MAG: phage integrase N-terminal SAM-like domain-containing protein [Polyangiaceae bacterium]